MQFIPISSVTVHSSCASTFKVAGISFKVAAHCFHSKTLVEKREMDPERGSSSEENDLLH